MNELTINKPPSLTAMLKLDDEALFSAPMLSHALALLEHEAGHIVPDVGSEEGRKAINKLSRAIGGAIKRLDERRGSFVAELKRRPAEIDRVFRESFRVPAEEFKTRVRRPLDEWDEAQRQAEEETDRLLAELTAPVESGTASHAIAARLDATINLDLPNWLSESQRAALAAAMGNAIPRLDAAHKAAIAAEEQAREIERLRQVEREAELMRAREQAAAVARAEATAAADQRAREAAAQAEAELMRQERARQDAERRALEAEAKAKERAEAAAQAERDRVAAEQEAAHREAAARANDREHKRTINREIIADLCDLGVTQEQAQQIVIAIASGKVAYVRIEY